MDISLEDLKFEEKLNVRNLKRKINDGDDDVIPQIVSDYRKKFCYLLADSALKWRKFKNKELRLHDTSRNQDCLAIYKDNCVFISPLNKKIKPYHALWTPKTLPVLTNDALRCIFSFLPPWELLNLRFVCKEWNKTIVNTSIFWNLKFVETKNTLRDYIYYMFLNVRNDRDIVEHFFSHPDLFHLVCKIVLGQERYKGKKATKYKLVFGNYILSRRTGELQTGSTRIKLQNFLEVYRQKICMHLPKSFQIQR